MFNSSFNYLGNRKHYVEINSHISNLLMTAKKQLAIFYSWRIITTYVRKVCAKFEIKIN